MTPAATPRAARRPPGETCPGIPLAPLIVLVVLVALLCERALRQPQLPRAIAETLIHHRQRISPTLP